jgi:hypothetical protein
MGGGRMGGREERRKDLVKALHTMNIIHHLMYRSMLMLFKARLVRRFSSGC